MTLDEDQNIFLVTSVFKVCKNQQIIRKHPMKLTLITFIINVSRLAFSRNNTRTIVSVTSFRLLGNQVSRNIVLAPRSVMITISYHFISQSDCSILSEVTRMSLAYRSKESTYVRNYLLTFIDSEYYIKW